MKRNILILLLSSFLMVNAQNETPKIVTYAAKKDIGKVKSLIKKGKDVNAKSRSRWSALSYAVKNNDMLMAKLLLDNGADTEIEINTKETPLSLAAKYNYTDMVKLLLKYNANVNAKDLMDFTVMHWVSKNNNKELVGLLLAKNAIINKRNVSGRTALDVANPSIKNYLIKNGAKTGKQLYQEATR